MCIYHGIYYDECGHVIFQIHLFCEAFFAQLHRINHPAQRDISGLPFELPGYCEPRGRVVDGVVDTGFTGAETNVVQWVTSLGEGCPGCSS